MTCDFLVKHSSFDSLKMYVRSFILLKAKIISICRIVFPVCPKWRALSDLHMLWVLHSTVHLSVLLTPFWHVILSFGLEILHSEISSLGKERKEELPYTLFVVHMQYQQMIHLRWFPCSSPQLKVSRFKLSNIICKSYFLDLSIVGF